MRPEVATDQQRSGALVIAASGTVKRALKGAESRFRVLRYRYVSTTTASTAVLTVTENFGDGAQVVRELPIADQGAGEIRVSGAVFLSATADAVGTGGTLHFALVDDELEVATVPPVDRLFTVVDGVAAPGAWGDVLGFPPAYRNHLQLYTAAAAIEFRLVDSSGVEWARWTVTGADAMRRHPPRFKLQARHPAGAAQPDRSGLACWTSR